MTKPILSRCGYRCDLCLAYRPNTRKRPQGQVLLSKCWSKYLDLHLPPEKVVCDGCLEEVGERIDTTCPVRLCTIFKGLDNCAPCDHYPCFALEERMISRQDVEQQVGQEISPEDYQGCIRPYENRPRLEALRRKYKKGNP